MGDLFWFPERKRYHHLLCCGLSWGYAKVLWSLYSDQCNRVYSGQIKGQIDVGTDPGGRLDVLQVGKNEIQIRYKRKTIMAGSPAEILSALQQLVIATNRMADAMETVFPQTTALSTTAPAAGTIVFTSSEATTFLSITTSSGGTYKVPGY